MFKREITYEDFNGEEAVDTVYFNLTKSEIVELNVGYEGGLEAAIQRIVDSKDLKSLVAEFKMIILSAYGVKSDDGKRFVKNDQLREEFSQTAAYDALFMELATNDEAAAVFIKGIVPRDLSKEIDKVETRSSPILSPPVPNEKE